MSSLGADPKPGSVCCKDRTRMPGQPLQSGVSKEDPDSLQRARPRRGWEKATLKEMALGRRPIGSLLCPSPFCLPPLVGKDW